MDQRRLFSPIMRQSLNPLTAWPILTKRKVLHMAMLGFAFFLPYLTWIQAAGLALLALLFNLYVLPRFDLDLRKCPQNNETENVWTGITFYPLSVLILILLYRHRMAIVGAVWAILALGDGAAGIAGTAVPSPSLRWNRAKHWSGLIGFILAGTLGAYALTRWIQPSLSVDKAFVVCAATAVVGAVTESLPINLDDNLTVPLISAAFMYCAYLVDGSVFESHLPALTGRILPAILINLLFALSAKALNLVTRSGAILGFVLGVAVYVGGGYKTFLILIAFFLLGSAATRMGYAKKLARGTAESRGGARSWREAAANSVVGAFFAILAVTTPYAAASLVALVAAFAEAAGDTVSSEIGQWISERAYRMTTFEPVPAGESGGVSIAGTLAGLAAAALVVLLGYALGLCGPPDDSTHSAKFGAGIALGASIAGNILDSLLGDTLERRKLLPNDLVNFAGTSFAGAVALVAALRWQLR
jgi:uncharacterized protein (TIGR00297 family)